MKIVAKVTSAVKAVVPAAGANAVPAKPLIWARIIAGPVGGIWIPALITRMFWNAQPRL